MGYLNEVCLVVVFPFFRPAGKSKRKKGTVEDSDSDLEDIPPPSGKGKD